MRSDHRIPNLRELKWWIYEDWLINDQSWARPGCQAMAVYRFGVWQSGLRVSRGGFITRPIYWFLQAFVRNFYGIELCASTIIGRRLRIGHQSGIIVHPDAILGDDCMIRQGVTIGRGPNHGDGAANAAPKIGDRVEIGANATVIGGITIGNDVTIGPNAVVMTNVPANSMVTPPHCRIFPRRGAAE
jgi:serine O-acetyltransferase